MESNPKSTNDKINTKKQLGKKRRKKTNENSNRNKKKEAENYFNYNKIFKCFHYLMNLDFEDEKLNKGKSTLGKDNIINNFRF